MTQAEVSEPQFGLVSFIERRNARGQLQIEEVSLVWGFSEPLPPQQPGDGLIDESPPPAGGGLGG